MRSQLLNFSFRTATFLLFVLCRTGFAELGAQERIPKQTSEPPRAPILRIDTGMHVDPIRAVDVDAENRYLVTAAEDKTVRIWDLGAAKQIRVLRPPITEEKEGMLQAVAISPDGETIATGGETGLAWEGSGCVYLFDRKSGRLIRRITGIEISRHEPIRDVGYSRNGRFLVVATTGAVRIYETRGYTLITQMDGCYLAEFGVNNKLVTVSHEGSIKLYDLGTTGFAMQLSKEITIPVNSKGYRGSLSVSFSPDGSKLAVGVIERALTADIPSIQVLLTQDLSLLYAPRKGRASEFSANVAWSADGTALFGGVVSPARDQFAIRKWADAGNGAYQELGTGADLPRRILPLKDGSTIYLAAQRATFTALDANGTRKFSVGPASLRFVSNEGRILLSPDAATVQFYIQDESKRVLSAYRFSLNDRVLMEGGDETGSLQPAITRGQDEELNTRLSQNRRIADFIKWGRLAISPDMKSYIKADSVHVWLHNKEGQIIWTVSPPADPLAVNISSNGKFAVVALNDGTIRWYRLSDGQELLAFFLHTDMKRWALWTPSGYYDASAGAEDLIGWHVNNGRDKEADFFPIGKFRVAFYRPNVVRKILQTGDEQLALRAVREESGNTKLPSANVSEQLPPVVEIISPVNDTNINEPQVALRYRLRSPSGEPVTSVKALVDGRPVALLTEDKTGEEREMRIEMPNRDVLVSIIAANRFTVSVPATLRLKWSGPTERSTIVDNPNSAVADRLKPVLYVLAIGVGKYQSASIRSLTYPAKDARDFTAALLRQKGELYRDVVVKTLTDEQATRDAIVDNLDWIRRETTARDVAVVFLAGHGDNDSYGNYFFLPHNIDPDHLMVTTIPYSLIKETAETLAGKVLFFVDTCHAANATGTVRRGSEIDINRIVNELTSAENGAVIFTASTGKQSSLEDVTWNNGAFTKAVVEGLNGFAALGSSKRITIAMLDVYVSERVKELTKGTQTPVTRKPDTVPDFPVAIVK